MLLYLVISVKFRSRVYQLDRTTPFFHNVLHIQKWLKKIAIRYLKKETCVKNIIAYLYSRFGDDSNDKARRTGKKSMDYTYNKVRVLADAHRVALGKIIPKEKIQNTGKTAFEVQTP